MSYMKSVVNPFEQELRTNAKLLVAPGKGILAADESTGTIEGRFKAIAVENTPQNRAAYRRALFSAEGLAKYVSGAILYDETLRDAELVRPLKENNILLGIKVDQGAKEMALSGGVLFTQGLSGLKERCEEYYSLGCRFAKWRAVLKIEGGTIVPQSIQETAYTLARYAATCQAAGLVPIVEPEILMDGEHCVGQCARWTERVMSAVVKALADQYVLFEGILLKINMCLAGSQFVGTRTFQKNAEMTVRTLRRTLPVAVPGVTFLSGGQSEEEASQNLNAINKLGPHPWALSFSFGRALQSGALKAWGGHAENVEKLQTALLARARANSEASLGQYKGDAAADKESLHVSNYTY